MQDLGQKIIFSEFRIRVCRFFVWGYPLHMLHSCKTVFGYEHERKTFVRFGDAAGICTASSYGG